MGSLKIVLIVVLMKKEQKPANVMVYGLSERGLSIGLWRHMLWIYEENTVDKLSGVGTAAQRLHSIKAFLFHTLCPAGSWLGVGRQLGWEGLQLAHLTYL